MLIDGHFPALGDAKMQCWFLNFFVTIKLRLKYGDKTQFHYAGKNGFVFRPKVESDHKMFSMTSIKSQFTENHA